MCLFQGALKSPEIKRNLSNSGPFFGIRWSSNWRKKELLHDRRNVPHIYAMNQELCVNNQVCKRYLKNHNY